MGTLLQSPRQCLVARERFQQREMGAWQAAALFLITLQDPADMTGIIPPLVSLKRHRPEGFHTLTPCLLSLSVYVCHSEVELLV